MTNLTPFLRSFHLFHFRYLPLYLLSFAPCHKKSCWRLLWVEVSLASLICLPLETLCVSVVLSFSFLFPLCLSAPTLLFLLHVCSFGLSWTSAHIFIHHSLQADPQASPRPAVAPPYLRQLSIFSPGSKSGLRPGELSNGQLRRW